MSPVSEEGEIREVELSEGEDAIPEDNSIDNRSMGAHSGAMSVICQGSAHRAALASANASNPIDSRGAVRPSGPFEEGGGPVWP